MQLRQACWKTESAIKKPKVKRWVTDKPTLAFSKIRRTENRETNERKTTNYKNKRSKFNHIWDHLHRMQIHKFFNYWILMRAKDFRYFQCLKAKILTLRCQRDNVMTFLRKSTRLDSYVFSSSHQLFAFYNGKSIKNIACCFGIMT